MSINIASRIDEEFYHIEASVGCGTMEWGFAKAQPEVHTMVIEICIPFDECLDDVLRGSVQRCLTERFPIFSTSYPLVATVIDSSLIYVDVDLN